MCVDIQLRTYHGLTVNVSRWYVGVEAAVSCCLTDLILFSVSPRADGSVDDHWIPAANIARARAAADAVRESQHYDTKSSQC